MAITRIPNIDEAGNFTNPDVLARIRDTVGGGNAAYDTFAGKPDAILTAGMLTDTRHKYGVRETTPGKGYQIANGALVHNLGAAGELSAAYASVELQRPVGRIWAEFTQDAGANATWEALAFIVSDEYPFTTRVAREGSTFERSAAHFVLGRGNWEYQVLLNPFELVTVASGTYTPAAIGTKQSVSIDFAGQTATITLPDGQVATATDPRIESYRGPHACIESFAGAGSNNNPIRIHSWGASVETPKTASAYATQSALSTSLSGVKASAMNATTAVTALAPTAAAAVAPGVTEISFTVPPSGSAILTVEAFVQITDPTATYLWGLIGAAGGTTNPSSGTSLRRILVGNYHGIIMARFVLTGMTPGARASQGLRHFCTVADAAKLMVGGANAYPFTITVQPF